MSDPGTFKGTSVNLDDELLSVFLSYRKLLKRPLFLPHAVSMDTEAIEGRMESKLEDFMTELREDIATFINTVCKSELLGVRSTKWQRIIQVLAQLFLQRVMTADDQSLRLTKFGFKTYAWILSKPEQSVNLLN